MARVDKRVKKFRDGDDLDIDLALNSLNALQHNQLLRPLLDSGMTAHEASEHFVEDLKIQKLVRLMTIYGIPSGETSDMLYALSIQLAQEFVRGFKVLPRGKMVKPAHRPRKRRDSFWVSLFETVNRFDNDEKSINAACDWLIKNHTNFKQYKAASLASLYRKKRRELDRINLATENAMQSAINSPVFTNLKKIAVYRHKRTIGGTG